MLSCRSGGTSKLAIVRFMPDVTIIPACGSLIRLDHCPVCRALTPAEYKHGKGTLWGLCDLKLQGLGCIFYQY